MKKFVLAAIAAMTLGMGVASAQTTNADFLSDLPASAPAFGTVQLLATQRLTWFASGSNTRGPA